MNKLIVSVWIFVLLCSAAAGQSGGLQSASSSPSGTGAQASANASSQANDSSFLVPEGSIFHVVLAKNVDAKKNKIGDEVITTTVEDLKSNGEVVIPKNSKVLGHITQIQTRSKEHPQSQIAIAFDQLVIKEREIALSASIQAVAAPETAPADQSEQSSVGYGEMGGSMGGTVAGAGGRSSPSGGGGRGSSSGVTGTAAGGANSVGNVTNKSKGARGLSASSQGVIGVKGLSLSMRGETSQDSTISSDHQNVHLERGTQFVLRVNAKS